MIHVKAKMCRAYERLMKKEGKEQFLPGLQYTPRQLFWISVASLQCNAIRDKQLLNIVLTGTHTLSRYFSLISLLSVQPSRFKYSKYENMK